MVQAAFDRFSELTGRHYQLFDYVGDPQADRVLVLHKGKVREQGAHAELLRADGLYARLHALQFRDPAGSPKPAAPEPPPALPEGGLA